MKRNVSFLHTSPAAISPLMRYYGEHAPEMEITNLLDDGILRRFASGDPAFVEDRFEDMLRTARGVYRAEAAMITCSAVSGPMLDRLRRSSACPILKVDGPMARQAAQVGSRIGVALTFLPSLESTRRLLLDAAAEAGRTIEIVVETMPDAYTALLGGNPECHDSLLLEGLHRLAAQDVNAIVLAQVSMARALQQARRAVPVPVLSSLDTSLAAIREILDAQ